MAKIGLKIVSNNNMAKCVIILRKYCNNSINEIRDLITNNMYVVEGYSNRIEDILCVKKMHDELCQNKIESKLFVEDGEITEKILNNIIGSHYIISAQTRDMMDQEADE